MTALVLFSLLTGAPASATAAPFQTRMAVLDIGTLETNRPAQINVWYPVGECPRNTARLCLADSAVTSKVVLFSHGSMGSAANYSWLGEGLAEAGFVVVGLNHYGESSIYGSSTQNPRSTAFTWQRAQDASAILTHLEKERLFQREINWDNVVAIGHSEGGQTAAMLAGARFDLRKIAPYCKTAAAKADLGCNYSRNSARAPDQFVALFNANYQDTRVKKIVLLDPAMGSVVQPASLAAITLPSLIIGATHNDFLPWESHGAHYAVGIPNARTVLLTGQEGHFVFLTPCRHDVRVMGVALCQDRTGVDRAVVQQELVGHIVGFVRLDNEPASVARQGGIPSNPGLGYAHPGSFAQILVYTPSWVWALLAGLTVFGLMQLRTRSTPVGLALLLPGAMLILSLTGVIQYVGLSVLAIAVWSLGLASGALLCLNLMRSRIARYDAKARRLVVAGSWLPLLVILTIFSVRYAMGVARGMDLQVVHDWNVQLVVSFLLGGLSGFFLARGIQFWLAFRSGDPRSA